MLTTACEERGYCVSLLGETRHVTSLMFVRPSVLILVLSSRVPDVLSPPRTD